MEQFNALGHRNRGEILEMYYLRPIHCSLRELGHFLPLITLLYALKDHFRFMPISILCKGRKYVGI